MFRVGHAAMSVHCNLVVTCWERTLLALLYVMFSCVFVTFHRGVLGQVSPWYLIVLIPDLCLFLTLYGLNIKTLSNKNNMSRDI